MSELFRVADPWGDEVVFTDDDWTRIVEKHSEVAHADFDEVKRAVEDPDFVHGSARNQFSRLFYRRHGIQQRPYVGGFIAVIVNYRSRPATIRTIYLTRRPKGAVGDRIYERGDR